MTALNSNVLLAAEFAVRAHRKQERKFTGEPYMVHPLSVARMVCDAGGTLEMVIAAVLHDVVEDCPWVKPSEIERTFGSKVAQLVMQVTKVSNPRDDRATRKATDRAHYGGASPGAQTIKLADVIDNTRTVHLHGNEFAAIYMAEQRELLKVLVHGDRGLYAQARRQVDEYLEAKEKRRGA